MNVERGTRNGEKYNAAERKSKKEKERREKGTELEITLPKIIHCYTPLTDTSEKNAHINGGGKGARWCTWLWL